MPERNSCSFVSPSLPSLADFSLDGRKNISDDGRQTNLNVPVNAFLTDTGLEAGKHYTFSLKVGKDAISITKVNVEPWTTKEIDGGVAEECIHTYVEGVCSGCGATEPTSTED